MAQIRLTGLGVKKSKEIRDRENAKDMLVKLQMKEISKLSREKVMLEQELKELSDKVNKLMEG